MVQAKSKKTHRTAQQANGAKETDLREVDDLKKTLRALTLKREAARVTRLRDTMIALNAALDPSSVTMTTTNIPDAIAKLAVVVRQMSAASHKVFELVEQQHALRNQLVQLAEQVGQHASMSALSPELAAKLLQEHRSVSDQLDNLGHEIVMAHEFQDLCGQSLYKVTALLEGLSRDLRELLPTLGITPPPPQSSSDNNPDLGQAEMDAIIRQLTTW